MQIGNLAKWIDELQTAIENVKKKLAKTSGIVEGLPAFDVTDPAEGQILTYEDGEWVNGDIDIPAGEEWEVLCYNASGFPVASEPIYTCPEGTSLSDFSELAVLQYWASSNVAQGKSLVHTFAPDIYQKLAAVEPTEGTFPFSAYANPIVYAFYSTQKYGFKLDFEHGTITQTDNSSDTGSPNFRVIAILGKRASTTN